MTQPVRKSNRPTEWLPGIGLRGFKDFFAVAIFLLL
jgi:hypothetical protein